MNQKDRIKDMASDKMKQMVKSYQHMMGMEETGKFNEVYFTSIIFVLLQGKLDIETMESMNMPRCGDPDTLQAMNSFSKGRRRFKRFMLQGSSWPNRTLTWKVTRYSDQSNLLNRRREIDDIMNSALNVRCYKVRKDFVTRSKIAFLLFRPGERQAD